MKKFVITFLVLIICAVASIGYVINLVERTNRERSNYNKEYENYYNKEIIGTELATIINKIADSNFKNNVQKDEQGNYLENDEDSIKMDIYLTDTDKIYPMEKIYSLGTGRFVYNFDTAKFKCTKIEYHKKSKKVKYIYFEQILN